MSMLKDQIGQGIMPLMSFQYFFVLAQSFGEDNLTHAVAYDLPQAVGSTEATYDTFPMLLCTNEYIDLYEENMGVVSLREPRTRDVLDAITCEICRKDVEIQWQRSGWMEEE